MLKRMSRNDLFLVNLLPGCQMGRNLRLAGPVIEVRGLRESCDGAEAVSGIDLEVRAGEVFAFLGPNGAGKTATVEILEGYDTEPFKPGHLVVQ